MKLNTRVFLYSNIHTANFEQIKYDHNEREIRC
jgi:hypothetical protein